MTDNALYRLAQDFLSDYEPDAGAGDVAWARHNHAVNVLTDRWQEEADDTIKWLQMAEAEDAEAEAEAHRTDEGDLGNLTILGGRA